MVTRPIKNETRKIDWMKRPKRIDFYLEDNFTKERAMIYSSPYCPVRDGLNGCMRRMLLGLLKSYREMNLLFEHNPNKFPGKNTLRIVKHF